MSKNINVVSSINSSSEKNNTVNLPNYDKEMLEDLIVAAVNDSKQKGEIAAQEEMKTVTGGIPLPPGMKLPF